jgi:uncharacterized protein YeaC (DUF1315 family)
MTLEQKKDALIEEMTLIPDAYERLGYIVDRGKKADGLFGRSAHRLVQNRGMHVSALGRACLQRRAL